MAEAIDARIPADANRKAWLRRRALEADLSYDTLLGYVAGENEPGVLNWRKLNAIFPGLGAAVFGDVPADIKERLLRASEHLRAADDALTAIVPIKGKGS